jgi:hypothetical protein
MREHFDRRGINAYLDTPGGILLAAQHGSREAAAAALVRAEELDRAWRRRQAVARAERYPGSFPSVDDAMNAVPDPLGGGGAWIMGTTDEIVAAVRWISPATGIRNLGGEAESGEVAGVTQSPGRPGLEPADTRPPWAREQG